MKQEIRTRCRFAFRLPALLAVSLAMGGLAFASCDSSEPRNVLGGMDPFETGEAPSLAIRERGTLDEAESSKGLPGSYVPGENDSWERATPLNEMRMGGILSLSGTLEAGLSLKGDGNGSTWADEDWYLLHVQCHGEVSWGIDGEGLYAAGWFLPASASSPQELSILGVASPGDAGKADLPSPGSFFLSVRAKGNLAEAKDYSLSFFLEEPSASEPPSPGALDAEEQGLPLHFTLAQALPGGASSFLGQGSGSMNLSWHPYWRELERVAPGGYVPAMNIDFLSGEVARDLVEIAMDLEGVSSFEIEGGILRYVDSEGWEVRHDFLAKEHGEMILRAAAALFGRSSDGIDMDRFRMAMPSLVYGLGTAKGFDGVSNGKWVRLSPYVLLEDGVASWGAGALADGMARISDGCFTDGQRTAYPDDYPLGEGAISDEGTAGSTYVPFAAFPG